MGRIISGRYEEVGRLGQGGQGVVYKVRHVEHKTDLALKVLPSYMLDDEELMARFEQEAQMMTRLSHHNIARVLGSGRDDELKLRFIVMEYIQGKNLKQYLQEKGSLPLSEVLEIARQVAGALAYTHTQPSPIIHRDIKPTNIMLEDFSGRAVVLDFGIAKELGESEHAPTRTGAMLGTWKYCAPEQLRHEPLTGSADVYSLGMVMYEMYTGTPFFSGLDEHAVLGRVLHDQREHTPYFARQTLPAFVTLVTKAIAKSRDKRYRRMADFLNDLEACWWALDDTRTMIMPPLSPSPRLADAHPGDIAELDEQIRRLEEERQRHTVAAIQGQVHLAKEQAERTGARQWAVALFEQGLARETAGDGHNGEQRYTQAQESYEAAITLFTQASEEANVRAAARQLEKERHDAYAAKADAERAGAEGQTSALYARALTTLTQADQLWAQQQGAQAEPLYQAAGRLFADARDLAYQEAQRREAEVLRAQTRAVREAALADESAALATTLFEEGQVNEQQAEAALEQNDLTQARRFYFAAQQKYENAQRQAKREQQRRQEVLSLATQTQTLQEQARALGESVQHHAEYAQAEALRLQALTLFDAHEYTKAGQRYTQARDLYEAALRAVEHELQEERERTAREAEVAARRRAEEQRLEAQRQAALATQVQQLEAMQQTVQFARTAADNADAQVHAAEEYSRAVAQHVAADQLFAQQNYQRAYTLYEDACRLFAHAGEQARHATVRATAELAQTYMQVAQKAALLVHADTLAAGLMGEAAATEQHANAAFANGEFASAGLSYETARQQYARAEAQARTEQQRQRQQAVIVAREVQVVQDRVKAFGPDVDALPAYQEARATHQRATTLFTENQYAQAEAAYQQARQQYEHAGRLAAQQQVTSAHERMRVAQEAAVQGGAPQFCPEEWTEAIQFSTVAQQHGTCGETAQAVVAFQQAQERFTQLRPLAEQRKAQAEEQQRQRTLTAQQTAEEARAEAEMVETPRYAAAQYERATQLMDEAAPHLQAARWQEALPLLTQAQELFYKASEDALRAKARQTAEAARAKAVFSHQETQKGKGPVYFPDRVAQAATLLRTAEVALQRGDFALARKGFEEGEVLLQKIHHTATVREQAEAELAMLFVPELPTLGPEVPPRPPATSSQLKQPEQHNSLQPLSPDPPASNQVQAQPRPVAPLASPPPRRVVAPPPSASSPSTIPPTTLPIGKIIGIGVVLVLVVGGYLLGFRSTNEPKRMASTPEALATPAATPLLPHEQKPTVPTPPPTPREQVMGVPEPTAPATPTETAPPVPVAKETPLTESAEPRVAPTPPPPPQLRPLTIRQAEPGPGADVTLREGEALPFSVTLDERDSRMLRYHWTLNGVEQSTEATWRYKPKFDEAEEAPKSVQVVVRDEADQRVEREWRVRVLNVNRAPTISTTTPRLGSPVDVAAGATQPFAVNAKDPDKDGPLTYRWLLDGDEVDTGETGTWRFHAPTSDGAHQVTVEIQDAAGEKIQERWDVVVKATAPSLRWVRVHPKDERVRTQTGQMVEFSALAELSSQTRGAAGIQYQWRVNETVRQTEEAGRFQFSEDRAGRYQLSVVALTAEGIKSPLRQWSLDVRELEPPPAATSPEETAPDSRAMTQCDKDVREWLESYRRAWETKNVRTLASLGVIARVDTASVAQTLKEYQSFRVILTDRDIRCAGDQATVSFSRVDEIDWTIVVHPERATIHLDKHNGQWVMRR